MPRIIDSQQLTKTSVVVFKLMITGFPPAVSTLIWSFEERDNKHSV